ncbi:Response regulator receiver domain protein [Roseovarius sp. THAF8]|uniref:response regulator n=1 Tax=Roseovarius TaxID=74030 RepID=UPI0012697117|nr:MULTISPECIES: response regulator [Roseovarius]MBY5989562.1 response regulator [Roseovarius atlanticus]MBY6126106.1 response regulator [Roseovarius atlanticus]MBY6150600.1 response regulator [Roseovarius atlanticus]QFT98221.1 Response regulator receiver domain protein [Roseovarius sp. THAF8]
MPDPTPFEGPRLRCLVLEDSAHDQEMIRRAMRGARVEAEIDFVPTIETARKALSRSQYSAILCDNSVPDGSGSEFAGELAGAPELSDVPIVIVSGWPSPFMWDKARAAGLSVIDKTDDPMRKLRDFFRECVGDMITQRVAGPMRRSA